VRAELGTGMVLMATNDPRLAGECCIRVRSRNGTPFDYFCFLIGVVQNPFSLKT